MKRLMVWAALWALCLGVAQAAGAEELTYYFETDSLTAGREYVLIVVSGSRESLNLQENDTVYYVEQKKADGDSMTFTVVRPAAFETATAFVVSETGEAVKRFVLNRGGETAYLPASLTGLEDEVFASSGVTHVIVPEGCLSIGAGAFANHPLPLVLELPESLTSIGDGALLNCPYAVIVAPAGSCAIQWAQANGVVYACAAP